MHEIGSIVAESARALHSAVWQASFYAATVRQILPRPGLPEFVERFEHESDARLAIDEEAGPLLRELGYEP